MGKKNRYRDRGALEAHEPADPPPPAADLNPAAPPGGRDLMMSFGQYRGRLVRAVPSPYLSWALREVKLAPAFQRHIRQVLAGRGHAEAGGDVMPFGRYFGHALVEVPLPYLHWVSQNATGEQMTATLLRAIQAILAEADYRPPAGDPAPPVERPAPPAGPFPGETPDFPPDDILF